MGDKGTGDNGTGGEGISTKTLGGWERTENHRFPWVLKPALSSLWNLCEITTSTKPGPPPPPGGRAKNRQEEEEGTSRRSFGVGWLPVGIGAGGGKEGERRGGLGLLY